MCQGIGQRLDHAYQAFLPSQLFPSNLKLLLAQPKVCAPQLIRLARDFHALMFPAHTPLSTAAGPFQAIPVVAISSPSTSLFFPTTGVAIFSPPTLAPTTPM